MFIFVVCKLLVFVCKFCANMKDTYSISIYLDSRRAKKNGKYPVKLRLFEANTRKQKLYATPFDYTLKEFESIWNTTRPRKEFKEARLKLQALENRANEIAQNLNVFSIEQFERKLIRTKGEGRKITYHFKQTINTLRKQRRLSTEASYKYSEKALKDFVENKLKHSYDALTFYDINEGWLHEFESYMLISNRSITTVGIYLRALRALFNKAIAEQEIEQELYPFGKRKYQIPSSNGVKKALTKEQIKGLFETEPKTEQQEKAKDFWFFSFNCNGMNIKDIALLKHKYLSEDKFHFYRAKTVQTSKASLTPITVYVNDYIRDFVIKYGTPNNNPEDYVFDILSNEMSAEKQHARIKNFTRFLNQHLQKLCKENDLPTISSYWARHSFATLSVQKGASLEFMRESLGHNSMSTTLNYFAGFDDESKKEFSQSLMDFE